MLELLGLKTPGAPSYRALRDLNEHPLVAAPWAAWQAARAALAAALHADTDLRSIAFPRTVVASHERYDPPTPDATAEARTQLEASTLAVVRARRVHTETAAALGAAKAAALDAMEAELRTVLRPGVGRFMAALGPAAAEAGPLAATLDDVEAMKNGGADLRARFQALFALTQFCARHQEWRRTVDDAGLLE